MDQQTVAQQRSRLSNKTVATVVALSAVLTFAISACGGGESAPKNTPVQRTKNAALTSSTTSTTCIPQA